MKTDLEKHVGGHAPPNVKHQKMNVWKWARHQLNDIDVYGKPITLNFNGCDSNVTTACGGIMSIILYVSSGLFLLYQFIAVIRKSETEFTSAQYSVHAKEMRNTTMQDFDDSFNMLLNIRLK